MATTTNGMANCTSTAQSTAARSNPPLNPLARPRQAPMIAASSDETAAIQSDVRAPASNSASVSLPS
jgi:hypothetical protein